MKVRFIVSQTPGSSRKAEARVTEAVREVLGSEEGIFEIRVASGRASAEGLSREALKKGYEAVFACGGDTLVNDVATQLVGTDAVLGVIPLGSGNSFASALGIPKDLKAAIGLLKTDIVRTVDVGIACGRYFFSTAGFAFEAHLCRKYGEGALSRKIRGTAPYYPLAMKEFFSYKTVPVLLRTDAGDRNIEPFLLTAANTAQFGGGAYIAPQASPDDGLIDICYVEKAGVLGAVGFAKKMFSRSVKESKYYGFVQTEKAVISGRESTLCHVDGQVFEHNGEISVGVLPKSLKVFVEYL